MRKNPWFSAVAVLTLAVGIGATTAVFSLVNAALLRALPYHEPQRLVFLYEPEPHFAGVPIEAWGPFNGDFYDFKGQNRLFTSLALFSVDSLNLSVDGVASRVGGSRVTGEFFPTLGISPELGRAVDADDDQPGKRQVAVISHALWHSRFGSDPGVLGKTLVLDAQPYRIVGETTDVWVP